MRLSLSLFYYSLKNIIRLSLPNKLVRNVFKAVFLILFIGGVALGILLGFYHPPQWKGDFRSQEFVNNLSGLFFFINILILTIPTLLTIRSSLKLLNNTEPFTLMNLSPVSSIAKFNSSIAPIIFLSSLPYIILMLPFTIAFLILDPLISAAIFLYFIVVSGWSVTLSFVSIVMLMDFYGRGKALKIAYLLPVAIYLIPSLFIYQAEDFRTLAPVVGYWQINFFLLSFVILPALFMAATKSFYNHLMDTNIDVKEFAPPKWGNYNPWDYIDREVSNWRLISIVVFVGCILAGLINFEKLNAAVLAIALYSLSTSPVSAVMQE